MWANFSVPRNRCVTLARRRGAEKSRRGRRCAAAFDSQRRLLFSSLQSGGAHNVMQDSQTRGQLLAAVRRFVGEKLRPIEAQRREAKCAPSPSP
jgi:hypothetical protein